MLKNQKQRCRPPVIASLMTAEQSSSASRPRKRQIIQELSKRKMKVIQTKSDNNHDRKMIADKKLKSLNLIPKQQLIMQEPFDQYQMGDHFTPQKRESKEIQPRDKYNQCLRDDSSSSNYGQIVSHYRQSKSRYKNAKDKAKKLIQKMIITSKNDSQVVANQLKYKMTQIKNQLPIDKRSADEYCMTERTLQKCSSLSGTSNFRPKVEKCSTLRFGNRESPLAYRPGSYRKSSNSQQMRESKIEKQTTSRSKLTENQTPKQPRTPNLPPKPEPSSQRSPPSQKQISTQKSIQTNSQTCSTNNENPLVLQGKHLFQEYGVVSSTGLARMPTQKQIIQETENACKEVSRQLPMSRKQTQKLITRARQKNKKIIGKLKQMRERRSVMRNSQTFKNDLSKSVSRFSKLAGGAFRSSVRQSVLQSRLEQLRSNCKMDSSGQNFLSLNSNVHSGSVMAFYEQVRQKILIHLQTIKTIADYAQSFTKIYQDCNEWEDLIFLLYKKYYIERFKIYHVMKNGFVKMKDGAVSKDSPFVFDFCGVNEQEIQVFRESKEQVSLELDLQTTNSQVKSALRDLYNKFIEKTSQNPSLNMYDMDDFSEQILQDLNQEINMLIESCGKSVKIKRRINEAIQVGLMIAHMEGYVLQDIEEIVIGDLDNRDYFDKFYTQFLEIFQDDDGNGK